MLCNSCRRRFPKVNLIDGNCIDCIKKIGNTKGLEVLNSRHVSGGTEIKARDDEQLIRIIKRSEKEEITSFQC
jgi:hypothetical protein